MSWAISIIGTRLEVLAEVKATKPFQHQQKLALDLVIDELSRPVESFGSNLNGVKVEGNGHSSPQGDAYDANGLVHKSGAFSLTITPIVLLIPEVETPV